MPAKPPFEIVVGTSTKSAKDAIEDARRNATNVGGEWISIASSVMVDPGTSVAAAQAANNTNRMLESMAQNIYTMAQCSCAGVGMEVKKNYTPPPQLKITPFPPVVPGVIGQVTWFVYILLKH